MPIIVIHEYMMRSIRTIKAILCLAVFCYSIVLDAQDNTINLQLSSDIVDLCPYTTQDKNADVFCSIMFDALLEQDWKTGELYPSLAEELPVLSPDHRSYTFKVRKGVTFSDNHPLTVQDVVFSLKVVKNPYIKDGYLLRSYVDAISDIKVIDSTTIRFFFHTPYYLNLYYIGLLRILPQHILDPENVTNHYSIKELQDEHDYSKNKAIKQYAKKFETLDVGHSTRYLIGSGPFALDYWQNGHYIRFKQNPNYWNSHDAKRQRRIDFIAVKVIEDKTEAITGIEKGTVDFVDAIQPVLFSTIDTSRKMIGKGGRLRASYTYVVWNTRRSVFQDRRVRQALSYLVNRDTIIQKLLEGQAIKQNSPVYYVMPDYDSTITEYEYNPKRALSLLAGAGWKDSDNDGVLDKIINGKRIKFEVVFLVNNGNALRYNIATILAEEFKVYGIHCTVEQQEWEQFVSKGTTYNFDAMIGMWVSDLIPTDLYQLWHSSQSENGGVNFSGFRNKRADELMELMQTEFNTERRAKYSKELQRIIHNEAPFTFLAAPFANCAFSKRLHNVNYYPLFPGYNILEWEKGN